MENKSLNPNKSASNKSVNIPSEKKSFERVAKASFIDKIGPSPTSNHNSVSLVFNSTKTEEKRNKPKIEPEIALGPPWFKAVILYDGDSYEIHEFFQQRIHDIGDVSGKFIHFMDIGFPPQSDRNYEEIRSGGLAKQDEISAAGYKNDVEAIDSEKQYKLKELKSLVKELEINPDQLPCIVFLTTPDWSPPAVFKLNINWFSDERVVKIFSKQLQKWLRELPQKKLITPGISNKDLSERFTDELAKYKKHFDEMINHYIQSSRSSSTHYDNSYNPEIIRAFDWLNEIEDEFKESIPSGLCYEYESISLKFHATSDLQEEHIANYIWKDGDEREVNYFSGIQMLNKYPDNFTQADVPKKAEFGLGQLVRPILILTVSQYNDIHRSICDLWIKLDAAADKFNIDRTIYNGRASCEYKPEKEHNPLSEVTFKDLSHLREDLLLGFEAINKCRICLSEKFVKDKSQKDFKKKKIKSASETKIRSSTKKKYKDILNMIKKVELEQTEKNLHKKKPKKKTVHLIVADRMDLSLRTVQRAEYG